jgi:hypothetical protein
VQAANRRDAMVRLASYRALETSEIDELAAKIDAQQAGRGLLERCSMLSANERAAIELVDLAELSPRRLRLRSASPAACCGCGCRGLGRD